MTELLDRIERQLVEAAAARPRVHRSRRHALAVTVGVTVALAGAGTVAAVTIDTPIDRLLSTPGDDAQRPGTARVDLAVANGWQVTTYVRRDGSIATVSALGTEGGELPPTGWASSYAMASGFQREGPARGTMRLGASDALVYGVVDASAENVSVSLTGASATAQLSEQTLSVPVTVDRSRLTEEGERLAASLPSEIKLRTFAAIIDRKAIPRQTMVQPALEVRLPGGDVRRQQLAGLRLP